MKPSLQLRLSQQLTMTPQLQQAIKLLQLSALDLQQEIHQAVESNPMLEYQEDVPPQPAELQAPNDSPLKETTETEPNWDYQFANNGSLRQQYDLPDTVFQGETETSLQDHLAWQLNLSRFSEEDHAIATAIIDGINNDGYLECGVEELQTALGDATIFTLPKIESVIQRVQQFDPVGVACRDLRECLLVQLHNLSHTETSKLTAIRLAEDYLELLAKETPKRLAQKLKVTTDELLEAVALIRSLNPKPGIEIDIEKPEYIIPDAYVMKQNDDWVVKLNKGLNHKLRINSDYTSLIKRADDSTDNQFLKNHLQEAKWFLKSLENRDDTLLRVASCIVSEQIGFLEHGEEAMRPLVLHTIAEKLDLHESTISRVTTRKYLHTPRGVFELKYFFSSQLGTASGGECSSTAIRAIIRKFVDAENKAKPLSDNKIAQLLSDQGIHVARRTIAKYRESMSIPPSSERKSLMDHT